MHKYKQESSNPKWNAQRNLQGRTHYVDDDTLRWHKSRILSTKITDDGLLFALIESCAADPENRSRVFRYAIFDIFGTVIERPDLENSFKRHEQANKAMWKALNIIDAQEHTLKAIEEQKERALKEYEQMRQDILKQFAGRLLKGEEKACLTI